MKWVIVFLVITLPSSPDSDPEPVIKRVCMGNGKYAAVLEYQNQYYVITSKKLLRKSYQIYFEAGFKNGGTYHMEYFDTNNNRKYMNITVLSRLVYKYSGYEGARSVCRQVTQR